MKEGAILKKQDSEQETTIKGRRMLTFTFRREVGGALTDRMMEKLADRVQTSFYLRYLYTYKIRNIETGEMRNFRRYAPGSPRMVGMTKARAWITKQEEIRLSQDNLDRRSTKWALVRFIEVQLTAILGRDALVGTEPLPDWLRRKRGLIALDMHIQRQPMSIPLYCHAPRHTRRSYHPQSQRASHGVLRYLDIRDIPKSNLDRLPEIEKRFKLGIRVYKPAQYVKEVDARNELVWSLIRQPAQYPNIMTIGMFEEHAFYIKDIKKVSDFYLCGHCSQSFTQACHLQNMPLCAPKVSPKSSVRVTQ